MTLPGDPMGGRHPTVCAGQPTVGRRGTLPAPGCEKLPAGGGGGGPGGLPLGHTPVNSRVGDVPLAGFPLGGDQLGRGPAGSPTADQGREWPGPISAFPMWSGALAVAFWQ